MFPWYTWYSQYKKTKNLVLQMFSLIPVLLKDTLGTSLAVQWLRLQAGGAGSIPGRGTKILHAVRHSQKKRHFSGSIYEKTYQSMQLYSHLLLELALTVSHKCTTFQSNKKDGLEWNHSRRRNRRSHFLVLNFHSYPRPVRAARDV